MKRRPLYSPDLYEGCNGLGSGSLCKCKRGIRGVCAGLQAVAYFYVPLYSFSFNPLN